MAQSKKETELEKHMEAIVVCNVFRNVHFMGCDYPKETILTQNKFWPTKDEVRKITGY